ncbi:transcription repressor OFP13-like [Musa acuminata AAA Group]|uniref:transcription repressor OFP13-like n=1 Tax=Musa acuminata AAA Group TaxID=214697 RepID=UPI0031DD59E4
METLKASFKHLQGAITSFKPISPICIQEAKTQSFREGDLFSAFRCSTSSTSFAHEEELTAMPTPSSSPGGPLSSGRFFFSPCTTKSILEEAKTEKSTPNVPPSAGKAAAAAAVAAETTRDSFYHESITMAMSSEDPYQDFRSSMEEMVAAHGLREWHSLQELLQCYLRLNEKKNHKVIVMAFVDLLMHLMDQQLAAASVRYRDP